MSTKRHSVTYLDLASREVREFAHTAFVVLESSVRDVESDESCNEQCCSMTYFSMMSGARNEAFRSDRFKTFGTSHWGKRRKQLDRIR